MIDLHSHILPGLDDGAATLDESLAIAAAAAGDGVTVIAATPHVRDDYPTSAATMERAVAEVRAAVAAAGIPLDVRPGGEIALDRLPVLGTDELRRFGLGGNPGYLLVESPYWGWPLDLEDTLFELRASGFAPVLAHPERNPEIQAAPDRLVRLVETGTLVQVTAASLDGRLGRRPLATGLELIERGLAHLIASDGHAPAVREIGLSGAVLAVGDERLARWLVEEVPAAILDGTALPARPERRRRWLRRT